MRVSLKWIKKYVDLPKDITNKQIAYDLTMRTVEVENVIDISSKFHDIVVGEILEVNSHPNADLLRVCRVDIGEENSVQIVCGGSNLYVGEKVVISKPGSEVYWHGKEELVKIKETKMRGVSSYGMICGATEVYLEDYFPPKEESEIVDLKDIPCNPGDNIADVLGLNDTILEIDNKSLTNRPDLWGHYGMARELATIYKVPLKELNSIKIDNNIKKYDIEILDSDKCPRYAAVEIDNIYVKESPIWMKNALINGGMRPINAIVDITNYVMLAVGQPLHAFDKTHVKGNKIIVRNAHNDEKLLLLDGNSIDLTSDDLVICDTEEPMALAGIKGGRKDSILPDTNGIVLEVANFSASTIRKTGKRFDEKTDASIRYEKGLDTNRVDVGISLALELFKDLFPETEIISYGDVTKCATKCQEIEVSKDFLDARLGKSLDNDVIIDILTRLGYKVEYKNDIFKVLAPSWRSTGDVTYKDDVMGDIARILGYENFEAKPLTINFEHAVIQKKVTLERRLREYLAFRCGFNEIFTYPWIDEKYIKAARINTNNSIRLATPPSSELAILRSSLVPGILDVTQRNLRYFDSFRIFEMAEVFEKGEYHESTVEETLPIHKKLLTGAIVGKNVKDIFFEAKGVIESMSGFTQMESLSFMQIEKPSWADKDVYLNIMLNNDIVGELGLVSVPVMNDAGIKRVNIAIFEIDFNKLVPFESRSNVFTHLPQFPLVEKDFSVLMSEDITWNDIKSSIEPMVKNLEFIEEYRGDKIPNGKKSITFRVKMGNNDSTMTNEQIINKANAILKILNKKYDIVLREE